MPPVIGAMKASGFCYTTVDGVSLGLLFNILLLSCVMEFLLFGSSRFIPYTCTNSSKLRRTVRWATS